jgi:hypothetical protein
MNKGQKTLVTAASLVVFGISAVVSQAHAFGLRVPQVNVLGGTLQGYLNAQGESINVLTDQQDAQVWATSASDNGLLTLKVELTGNAPVNTLGIYNASNPSPPLYQLFPGTASAGWFAVMSFRSAPVRVVVNLFDNNAAFVGSTTYLGVDPNNFGFYLQSPTGPVLYSQDSRNPGGSAQMLAYQGTGINAGEWWLCWEDTAVNGAGVSPAFASAAGSASDQDYDDAVCILESINPLATQQASLGAVKAMFRK